MKQTVVRIAGAALVAALTYVATGLDQPVRTIIGIAVGVPSLVLMFVARSQLGTSFSVRAKAKGLVKSGLYKRIQHPLYFFLDLVLAALIVVLGWPLLLIVWGLLVVNQLLQARREERVLSAAFSPEYESYREATWF